MSLLKELHFHPATEEWFFSRFEEPSPAQQLGWPKIAGKEHTLILAPTGSGKTLAAFLWCIDELFRLALSSDPLDFERNKTGVHTLYISPLKALNNDIQFNLQQPLKGIYHTAATRGLTPTQIRVAVRTGDTTAQARQSMIKKPPHILITTPESLYLLLTSERGRSIFSTLRYLIIDEIHALCNNKRGVHLSLSIERLTALLKQEPTRIGLSATQKPLERIAAFLGGLMNDGKEERLRARPVAIVDAGSHKAMNVRVMSPVSEWSNLPNDTVWPQLIDLLYQLITSHRNSLIFVNMRAQTEKIARFLNEKHRLETGDESAELALAHHGSISREIRYDIEARLKRGLIPAVIATASLELGIDIGSIDLVVQIQSPTSVSSALQRIGRSGHLLHSTSNGVIIPLYQADLDDCLAIAAAMQARDIEETVIPENALDVLAQQILAEVSMRSISRSELYSIMRRSYCYRYLSENAFNQVIEMLSGHYQLTELRALYPRLSWDRVNDVLIARKGVRLLAVSSGGTIADRGYYGVYLEGANTRLGEVEEEFVFESKVGDVFFLGNNEWRINQITRDRIMVTPLASVKPRAPFWKAEPLYREMSTSMKIGAYRRQCLQRLDQKESRVQSDAEIALLDYLESQREKCGAVATDSHIVIEYFHDSVREPHVFIHAPFGGRVLGAWATALAAALEKRAMTQVQFTYDDEGMLFRLLDTETQPPFEEMLYRPFEELKTLLVEKISQTAMFLVRFRHNATRALLLQRSRLDKRIPLWLQRLRASDLLQTILKFPDFPILMETYRDCLEDLFDISGLQMILRALADGKITVSAVQTSSPSPMTSGLLFRFLAEQMYDYDRTRVVGHAAEISSDFLADILSRQQIPALVTVTTVEAAEAFWQFTHPERRARDAEDLYEIIAALAPIATDELVHRCSTSPEPWLNELKALHRIQLKENQWLPTLMPEHETPIDLLRRTLRRHGPLTLPQISRKTRQPLAEITLLLDQLFQAKEAVRGRLVLGIDEEQWCDRENFALLYRQTIAQRRIQTAADKQTFRKFVLKYHFAAGAAPLFETMVQKYAGLLFPLHTFEQDILSTRFPGFDAGKLEAWKKEFQDGEIHAIGVQEGEGTQYRIRFNLRGGESIFAAPEAQEQQDADLPESAQRVYRFLRE
ncbi:MAG: DEAD/DEAH box helicase, partial [Calditrichaeota bacterium]